MEVVMANSYATLTTTTSPSSFHSALCRPFKASSTISTRQRKLIAKRYALTVKAASTPGQRDFVLEKFYSRRALKIISGLRNFNKENVASVVTAAQESYKTRRVASRATLGKSARLDSWVLTRLAGSRRVPMARLNCGRGGATHVDIACDPELVKLAISLTCLPVCVSAVEPEAFVIAVEAGAHMVEIGNYDSFYESGRIFSSNEILQLTMKTRQLLPSVVLSVTVPHTLSLTDQVTLAESLETEGVDIIQTEGGTSSDPSHSGVHGLIEKAVPTLAAAYSLSRAVRIPVMCASGLSSVTAPMALAAGAAGVGVGSAVSKLNNQVAMIAEVKSIADALGLSSHAFDGSFPSVGQRSVCL